MLLQVSIEDMGSGAARARGVVVVRDLLIRGHLLAKAAVAANQPERGVSLAGPTREVVAVGTHAQLKGRALTATARREG